MSWVRLDGRDGRLFGRKVDGGEISCWVNWVRHDGTDGRLFDMELGGERYRAG